MPDLDSLTPTVEPANLLVAAAMGRKAKPLALTLSPQQQALVDYCMGVVGDPRAPRRIGEGSVLLVDGPAGSGKSTTERLLAERLGARLTLCATTHKAARIAAEKSGRSCVTADSLARRPSGIASEDRGLLDGIATRKDRINMVGGFKTCDPGQVVVCDEASMLSKELFDELRRYAAPGSLVLIGDEFQLPPVSSGGFNVFALNLPKLRLSQVFRQKKGSPVLEAAMTLRSEFAEGTAPSPLQYLDRLPHIEMHDAIATMRKGFETHGRDFICLTYKNAARQEITAEYRRTLGYAEDELHEGEPVLVVQAPPKSYSVSKGEVVTFQRWIDADDRSYSVTGQRGNAAKVTKVRVRSALVQKADGDKVSIDLLVYADAEFDHEMQKQIERRTKKEIIQAEFGYVLTTHKAQGSQADHVLVFYDEIHSTSREHRYRWAYTAITRAAETCTVCVLPRSAITSSSFKKPEPLSADVAALFGKVA